MKKYAKILDNKTKEVSVAFGTNPPSDYIEMDVEQAYTGNWYLEGYAPQKPAPTKEEQKEKRAEAYRVEVDPITSQISRLRDEEQTTEIIEKINELLQKRNELVVDIQERYPYPEEE